MLFKTTEKIGDLESVVPRLKNDTMSFRNNFGFMKLLFVDSCYFSLTYNGGGKSHAVLRFFQILPNPNNLHSILDYFSY